MPDELSRCIAILECDSAKLLECNSAFEKLVGRCQAEMRGASIFDLLAPTESSGLEILKSALNLKAGTETRLEVLRPSEAPTNVSVHVHQFERDQRPALHTTWSLAGAALQQSKTADSTSLSPSFLLRFVDRLIASNTLAEFARVLHAEIATPLGFSHVAISTWIDETPTITPLAVFPTPTTGKVGPQAVASSYPDFASKSGRHAQSHLICTAGEWCNRQLGPWSGYPSRLHVRSARFRDRGLQVTFYSEARVRLLPGYLKFATSAANYLLEAYQRVEALYSRHEKESLLQTLLTETSGVTGKQFFDTLVQQLALVLKVEHTLATRYADSSKTSLRTISYWANGGFRDDQRYEIANTPCFDVLDQGELVVDSGLQDKYPDDAMLVEMDVNAYLGMVVRDRNGTPIGHLCALSSQKIENTPRAIELLRFFGKRVSAELSRIDREERIHDALTTRGVLIELLQISLSEESLESKLNLSAKVTSSIPVGHRPPTVTIYTSQGEPGDLMVAAPLKLEKAAPPPPTAEILDWFGDYQAALDSETIEGSHEPLRSGWLESNQLCLIPMRSQSTAFGLLALRFEVATEQSSAEFEFIQAAASTIAGMIERERSITALGEAEGRVLRSQRLEAVGQLAGGIAHDFNNLLTAIMGNVDLLNARIPDLREVSAIRRASESAGRMTSQLLAFTRRQVLQPERLDVGKAVTDIALMLGRIIPENIKLTIDAEPTAYFTMADAGQIQQVLMNLVVNARDAMPVGGLMKICVTSKTIDESNHDHELNPGTYALVTVSDNGVGIAPESLERIFEPFYTTKVMAEGSRSEGTGLGLSVVYGIVKQHGGVIEVESQLNQGTEFRVYLSADFSTPSDVPQEATQGFASTDADATILVVEDEKDVRDIAARLLESLGYSVLTASGGPEALAMYADPRFQVDAVLLDVVMPVMSGIETFEKLRSLRSHQKVVFMTGHDPTAGLKDLLSSDQAALLLKPFTRSQLGESIRVLLSQDSPTE